MAMHLVKTFFERTWHRRTENGLEVDQLDPKGSLESQVAEWQKQARAMMVSSSLSTETWRDPNRDVLCVTASLSVIYRVSEKNHASRQQQPAAEAGPQPAANPGTGPARPGRADLWG